MDVALTINICNVNLLVDIEQNYGLMSLIADCADSFPANSAGEVKDM